MARPNFVRLLVTSAMVPFLAATVGIGAAQAQYNDHHQTPQDHHDQNNNNHDQNNNNHDQNNNNNFRFRDQDRNQLQSHYKKDVTRYQSHPQGRPQYSRGQHFDANTRFQPVPASYYRGMPPPPAGYRYGYSNGYVVTYNPTARVIGDVLDLVGAATR